MLFYTNYSFSAFIRARLEPEVMTRDEIKAAVDFMKRTPPTAANKNELLRKFVATRTFRLESTANKKISSTDILQKYPLLMTLIDAVS